MTNGYNNECFGEPVHADGDSLEGTHFYSEGSPDKVYHYGRMVEVSVYHGEAVVVYYEPSGRIVNWDWSQRQHAFDWATERSQHVRAAGF